MFKIKAVIFFLIVSLNAFAQNEWAPLGAKWYYSVPGMGGNPYDSVLIYEVIEDTIINNALCKIVSNGVDDHYIMYESNSKVYFWQNNQFNLVYDFNVVQGDTAIFTQKALIPDQSNPNIILDTILNVSVVIDSISFKKFDADSLRKTYSHYLQDTLYPQLAWSGTNYDFTERLGGDNEIINVIKGISFPENDKIFRCYCDSIMNYVSEWWEYQSYDCDYTTLINNHLNNDLRFKLFPNPAKNQIEIITEEGSWVEVYDIQGKCVLSIHLQNENNTIDLSTLRRGVYHFTMYTEKRKETIKIIKK